MSILELYIPFYYPTSPYLFIIHVIIVINVNVFQLLLLLLLYMVVGVPGILMVAHGLVEAE